MRQIGRWPWPRQIQATLIAAITSAGPAALGIDLLWPEPGQQSPEQWLKHAGSLSDPLVADLAALPSHDAAMAKALSDGPSPSARPALPW